MVSTAENNKRIAKNTLFLFFRMFIIMSVSLYTVRVVIATLGIIDYGIYSAVGSIVLIMTFLSQTVSSAAQRFFSYELNKGVEYLQRLFSSIVTIYFIIGLVILIVSETIGLWFLYNKMLIPQERMDAVFWVFQFSLLTFLVTIISTPYNAIIIAHEDMEIFAYVSIFEAVSKLIIVYLLLIFSVDRLVLYAVLLFVLSCLIRAVYGIICLKKYPETKFIFYWNKNIFRSIFSYSSWTLFGTMAGAANNQGIVLLLNMFFGPVANAAQSVGHQVSAALQTFSGNIFTAIRPPLIKSYADGNYEYMMNLFYKGSKYSFFLLYVILFPLAIKMQFVLDFWLGTVGEYMVEFCRLMMAYVVLIAIGQPITIIMQAANRVKLYHGVVDGFALVCLPLSYVGYKYLSLPASTAFWVLVVVFAIAHCIRLVIMRRVITFSYVDYLNKFILPVSAVVVSSAFLAFIYGEVMGFTNTITGGFLDSFVLIIVSMISVVGFGMQGKERGKLLKFVLRRK